MQTFELYNKYKIPVIGYGTFPQKETLENNVPIAYNAGYRMIDASDNYFNEEFVGTGLERIGSANMIVVSKFSQPMRTEVFEKCFSESFEKLQCPDVKNRVYLLHWPFPYLWKKEWREMEDLYLSGNCAAIGVCNFDVGYLKDLLRFCRVKPMINQFERHPLFQQNELVELCRQENIQVMSYSPLARMDDELNNNPILKRIADKYGKTVNQIIIRWNIDTRCIPIPASSSEPHIKENIDVFDFKLTDKEITEINSLDRGKRIRYNPRTRFDKKTRKTFYIESFKLKSNLVAKIINIQEKVLGKLKNNMKKIYSRIKNIFKPSKYSMKIFIDNYGFKNRGDQLMIQSVLEQVRKNIPMAQLFVRENVFLENPSYCITNKLFPVAKNNSGKKHWRIVKKITNRLIGDDWIVTPNEIDVVLDCCGYFINDVWHKTEKSYNNVRNYYSMFNKPNLKVIYLPQAFGPFTNEWSQKIGKLAYQRATKIYARDEESYRYLHELIGESSKLSMAPDFTCLLPASTAPIVQLPTRQYVLVIPNSNMIINTKSDESNSYLDFLRFTIDHMVAKGEQVYLLNHEGDEEEKLLVKVNEQLRNPCVILTKLSGQDIKGIIKNAKLVITARFHGAVSSLTQQVPTLCTSWSHKYAALLHEHKCEQSMLSVTDIAVALSVIDDALQNPSKYVSKDGCEAEIEKATKVMWADVFKSIR